MNNPCQIPANPDISGIGVRAAIYAQNLLCFAPVVAHLWDGTVSADEMRGVKDQSIGMLAIAFAILISTIIGAVNIRNGQNVTSFHATVILDLSWMNNTSTWIWFLLYAHHLTKPAEGNVFKDKPIPAIWSAWTGVLLSPLRLLTGKVGSSDAEKGASGGVKVTFVQRAWYFVSEKPVLTLGSAHLSLMGGIGLWLWSDPSKFGTSIGTCNPSITVVGGAVRFASPGLRIFSLAIYSLLVIPGLNLVLPFLFFLALHITYNKSRARHATFWRGLEHLDGVSSALCDAFRDQPVPYFGGAADSSRSSPVPTDISRYDPATHTGNPEETPFKATLEPPKNHTAFLLVGLVCLAVINIILLLDIELTLRRNKGHESPEEDNWGFGQILALLLLVVPLRDFWTSIVDIREKVTMEKEAKENIQRSFEKHLREAINGDTLVGHDFPGLIDRGADHNTELKDDLHFKTLLQLAAHKGNENLVRYLQGKNVEDKGGNAFLAAARNEQLGAAYLLRSGNTLNMAEMRQRVLALIKKLSEDSDWSIRCSAISCLSSLGAQMEFQQEIRPAISGVIRLLEDSDWTVCQSAVDCLSNLAAQVEFQQEIRSAISGVIKLLEDSNGDVRQSAVDCLSSLGAQVEFQQEIQPAISGVIKLLGDSNWHVRWSAVNCLSSLGAQVEFQQEIQPAISGIIKLLEHSDSLGAQVEFQQEIRPAISGVINLLEDPNGDVRQFAVQCLSSLGAQVEFQQEIQPAISGVIKLLEDSDGDVRQFAVNCLSSLGAQVEFQQEIQPAISGVIKLLEDSDEDVRESAVNCLSSLGAQVEFQQEIQPAISGIIKLLEDSEEGVRGSAVDCLSSLGAQAEFQQEIQPAISGVIKLLGDSNWYVRQSAVNCLSSLKAQVEFQQEIQPAISGVIKLLGDSNWHVHQSAVNCLSSLKAQVEFQQEIQPAISGVIKLLGDSNWYVRQSAVNCLSSLGAQVEFQQEIQPAISGVIKLLGDSNWDVLQSAVNCLSSLGAQVEFQQEIQPAISGVIKLLEDSNWNVHQSAVNCLSSLGAQVEFQQEIQPAISGVIKLLEHSNWNVRQSAVKCLSSLGAQVEFQQEIQAAISGIIKLLEDSNEGVRGSAVDCLSSLGAQAEFQQEIRPAILEVIKLLEDPNGDVHRSTEHAQNGS
ncbi:armadillo-type protein [Mycena capillaripes]|nr:armadillo-type protein [Mycena capillaripes]